MRLPTKALQPPSGDAWVHEIKHDGFRVIARKDGNHVRLYSRPGNDLTYRFPLIVKALARLRSRSCIRVLHRGQVRKSACSLFGAASCIRDKRISIAFVPLFSSCKK
jgi:hypothetical protein